MSSNCGTLLERGFFEEGDWGKGIWRRSMRSTVGLPSILWWLNRSLNHLYLLFIKGLNFSLPCGNFGFWLTIFNGLAEILHYFIVPSFWYYDLARSFPPPPKIFKYIHVSSDETTFPLFFFFLIVNLQFFWSVF